MSELTCKQCKETYDTSWGYHNDDYCTSHCHIDSLKAENAELKADNERLREALEHYASTENWTFSDQATYDDTWLGGEGWKIAREALEAKG